MRLAKRKRPAALVELVAQAESMAGPGRISLTILGEGPERARVERHVREHDLGWVRLPGRVSREELRERYAASDVYLSPARLESFGIAALEARTVGLPVIGRSGSGVGEFVQDGVNGLVVSSDSEMASAIAALQRSPRASPGCAPGTSRTPPEQEWSQVAGWPCASTSGRSRSPGADRLARPMRTNVPGGVHVVGVVESGTAVARAPLGHGADPAHVLAAAGWAASRRTRQRCETTGRSSSPTRDAAGRHTSLGAGGAARRRRRGRRGGRGIPAGRGLCGRDERARRAADAVQLAGPRPGAVGLPGGGLDEGEEPVAGVHREVWEETGQQHRARRAGDGPVAALGGAGAVGGVEDFHAVRIVFAATCSAPGEPVIHDVGGTTSDARWFTRAEVAGLLDELVVAGTGTLSEAVSDTP